MPAKPAFVVATFLKLRNAVIAGVCGVTVQSGLMAARRSLEILPSFQPYDDLQRLLAVLIDPAWAQTLSWLLPMTSGAVIWSSIFAWTYERIPATGALGKGLIVTAFAWLFTGLVLLPMLGHGLFAVRVGAGGWPALMMLAMLAAYCLTLSLVYAGLGRKGIGSARS